MMQKCLLGFVGLLVSLTGFPSLFCFVFTIYIFSLLSTRVCHQAVFFFMVLALLIYSKGIPHSKAIKLFSSPYFLLQIWLEFGMRSKEGLLIYQVARQLSQDLF